LPLKKRVCVTLLLYQYLVFRSTEILNHLLEDMGVVSYQPQCGVAVVAENTPYLICAVAVVNTFLG
jgi:hypothetical protein